jgi:hypothetical protein
LFVIIAPVALPFVAVGVWRLQTRIVGALVPGADFVDVAALADLPLAAALDHDPPKVGGPPVHLLAVTRETASLFVAYRAVASGDPTVTTLLLDVTIAGHREIALLRRWRSVRTPVLVGAGHGDRTVAIQEPTTRLTVTLPVLALP